MDPKLAKNGSNVKKKPEIQYYRPGQGIAAKRPEAEAVGNQKLESNEESKPKNENKLDAKQNQNDNKTTNSNNNKVINKKPDIKVYVPPKLTTNVTNNSDKGGDKQNQRPVHNIERPEKKPYSRSDSNPKSDRNERRQRNEKPQRTERNERIERQEKYDRPEKSVRHDRSERIDRHERPKNERHERPDELNRSQGRHRGARSDRRKSESKGKTPTDDRSVENKSENFTKIKNFEQTHHKINESHETEVIGHTNRNSKHFEPKIENKLKPGESVEEYDDYYNVEFEQIHTKDVSKSQRQRQSRHNNQNSSHGFNRNDIPNDNKPRNRPDSHRKYPSNKGQHNRYVNTFEQQLPPRFLKQQQLKKKHELQSEEPEVAANEQTSDANADHSQTVSDAHQHRGLIRLPTNNQLNQTDWNGQPIQPNLYTGLNQNPPNKPINANKPCVAIRPTQHVVASNPPQYSPSSSPDTNLVDNYQQLSPYMRSNSEYAIPHFISAASADNLESARKKPKTIIEKSLNEVMALENDLLLCINDQKKLEQIRWRIQLRYEHIILNDLRICAELNIEQKLWKSAFYQFIEHYRRQMEQNIEQQSELKLALHKVIDEASVFFDTLLEKMQETYGFVIDKLLAHEYDSETENYDTLKLAAISAQKIYLYLGDLWRYRECETRNSNYIKSRFFYTRAQQLAPKNGRSYNQLAILANYQKRRLDAVYNYMRSLAASNPFWTARENLLTIFDEVRRKYEMTEKKRKQDLMNQRKKMEEELKGLKSDKERLEIWIRSDGTSAICSNYKQLFEEESEATKEDLDSFSSVDLNKRFLMSFLHVHGKLFSRVGMETFIPVVNQMLAEFRSLLRRSPIPFMSQRLSQLLAINMFAVFNTSLKETSYGQNCRSLLQEQALQVTLAMISLILECAIKSMEEQQKSQRSSERINDDLSELLPTIKLWTDWMSCQKQLWCPPPPPSDFKFFNSYRGDVWSIFAEFLTMLTKINVRSVKLLGSKLEGCEPIILPEDTDLAGFLPLMGAPQCIQFAQPFYDKEKARTCLRITAIQYFGDYLCGIVEPYLKYDVEKKRYISLIPSSIPSIADENNPRTSNDFDNSETEIDEFSADMTSIESNLLAINELTLKEVDDMDVENLWSRQEILRKEKDRREMIKQHFDAVLSEENQRKPSRIIIQPRYIIPDTNCYIDHLGKIKTIIDSKLFDLIVPLIVINELNGLKARGIRTAKPLTFSDDHIGNVGKMAAKTIDYLVSAFNSKSSRLKAITSKGSLLDNINFISESLNDSQGNSNDDFILHACLHFVEDKPLEKTTKESALNSAESKSIFREVALLTDDRNLRVKALGHNVPVKSLKHFMKWANIPQDSNQG